MKNSNPLKKIAVLLLAAVLVMTSVSLPAQAASSSEIQSELDDLRAENRAIQTEINAIRSQIGRAHV